MSATPSEIAYVTDVEGNWDKLASFAAGNPRVWLEGEALRLADGVTFVFGGDAIDRGPHGRRIVATLLAARAAYGDRVILLVGNRDLNKLRLVRELDGAPPPGAPVGVTRGELLRWIFANTMGASRAFEHRATELALALGGVASDDAVVQSFVDDLAPGGALRTYLGECRLGYRAGATLFLHGGVTGANFGVTPGDARAREVDGWLATLDRFYRAGLAEFAARGTAPVLIAYQAPLRGTSFNQGSVIYARPTDIDANPQLPEVDVIGALRDSGVTRLVVGHTPSGDCPAVLRDDGFELVLADNSYGRVELGAQVAITDDAIAIDATTQLDDGTRARVRYRSARIAGSPLGRRDRDTGQLVKAMLDDGRYLLFRGLPERKVEQLAVAGVDDRTLIAPRE